MLSTEETPISIKNEFYTNSENFPNFGLAFTANHSISNLSSLIISTQYSNQQVSFPTTSLSHEDLSWDHNVDSKISLAKKNRGKISSPVTTTISLGSKNQEAHTTRHRRPNKQEFSPSKMVGGDSDEDYSPKNIKTAHSVYKKRKVDCECMLCSGEFIPPNKEATWKEITLNSLQLLTVKNERQFFQMKTEILSFMDSHWQLLWGSTREKTKNWRNTVGMVLSKYRELFVSGTSEMNSVGYWGLRYFSPKEQRMALLESGKEQIDEQDIDSPLEVPEKQLEKEKANKKDYFLGMLAVAAEEFYRVESEDNSKEYA